MLNLHIKRGDTFVRTCTYMVDDAPAQLPDQIRSQVRERNGSLVDDLTVTRQDETGGVFVLRSADTANWYADKLYCDIEYTDSNGRVFSTDTFAINVLQDVTHD